MNITIITTVRHNVGDDFVRDGLIYILQQKYKGHKLIIENIHKHSPITSRYGFEWFRNYRLSKYIDEFLPLSLSKDRILEADIILQSGAPVYWCHPQTNGPHCSQNEWFKPLIIRRCLHRGKIVPFLNLAAGSCQSYASDGSEFKQCQSCQDYITKLQRITNVTTVRDKLAKKVLNNFGFNVPLIPCASIFAPESLGIKSAHPEFVVLNYMKGGAHFVFGQKIESEKWESNFRQFYECISKHEKCVFVCHSPDEVVSAHRIDSNANVFVSKDYRDYVALYAKAKYGVMNRIHGAFLVASFGRPAIIIGNDSRAKMADEIGLPHAFVNDANLDWLLDKYEHVRKEVDSFSDRFHMIKKKAYDDYQIALSPLEI